MFRIGQKVVAVIPEGTPRKTVSDRKIINNVKNGEIYKVIGLITCTCGQLSIDIGAKVIMPNGVKSGIACGCKRSLIPLANRYPYYYNSKFFRPIDEAFGENVAAAIEEQFALDHRTEYATPQ